MITTLDLKNPAFHRNPHPVLKALREWRPLYFDEGLGTFIATGYEPVRAILSDQRFTPDRRQWKGFKAAEWNRGLGDGGPAVRPRHSAVRRLLTVALRRDDVDAARPYVDEIVEALLHNLLQKPAFDLVAGFSADLPARTFFRMLGVPADAMVELLPLARKLLEIAEPFLTLEQAQRCADAGVALEAYFIPLIDEREHESRGDGLSRLVSTAVEEDLTRSEIMSTIRSVIVAATQTTPYLIANGMLALLRHPRQFHRLRAGEVAIGPAIDELLRFDAPSKFLFRVAKEPVVVLDQTIEPGQAVLASPLAANRDPTVFRDPDVLDLSRNIGAHIAFGYGPDACPGARLARIEATIAFEALVTRLPDARLAVDPDTLDWHEFLVIHGLKSLPLER